MKKPAESQRKAPKQERSKALVDAILEATARILPKIGSENLTTKKIAEFAGVSIGSLYQYFPNKESVLIGIIDKMAGLRTAEFEEAIESIGGKSMEEATDTMVELALNLFLTEKEKTREIYRQAPELGRLPSLLKLRHKVVVKLAERMKEHHPGRTADVYMRLSFTATNSVMGIIQTMLYDETQTYSKDELARELKMMLHAYFTRAIEQP